MSERIVTLTDHQDAAQVAIIRDAERCAKAQSPFEHGGALWMISRIDVEDNDSCVIIDGEKIA